MINFLLIGLCIFSGILFRRSGVLPLDAHKGINAWLIYLGLPAVSLKYLPSIQWSTHLLFPVAAPLVIWLGAWLYVKGYACKTAISKPTEGGLRLSAGLSNTSFVGFPLVMAYFGEKELGTAIICDQVTFTLLSTAGVIVAIHTSKKEALTAGLVLKRVLRFPPFLACLTALTLPHFLDLSPLAPLFDKLAGTVTPLALFSIGLQLKFAGWRGELPHITAALLYKLFLAPGLVFLLAFAFGLKGTIPQVSVFETAMPTLLTSSVVADEYNLNPKLSNLIIGIGILLGLGTTALWWFILQLLR